MNNYRITFHHEDHGIDYWKDFGAAKKFFPIVRQIFDVLVRHEVKLYWFFYEPFVEITWIDDGDKFKDIQSEIEPILFAAKISDEKWSTPANGNFADWFCDSPEEMEFGAKRHALSTQYVLLCDEYADAIQKGKGVERQLSRTIHTIANPLTLNFKAEARLCLRRGVACALFSIFPHKVAVWIFRHIFFQKY